MNHPLENMRTMRAEDALLQNPASIAPDDITRAQEACDVTYIDFDGKESSGTIVIHRLVSEDIRTLFAYMKKISFPIAHVVPVSHPAIRWDDDISVSFNNTSGFNYRTIAGTNRLSWHAKGLAIDINPLQNPFIRFNEDGAETFRAPKTGVYDIGARGTLTVGHPVVLFLKERGWEWGGDWAIRSGRIDYQHFEKHLPEWI